MTTELDLLVLKTITTNKKYALEFASDMDVKLFSSDVWNFANVLSTYIKTYKDLPTLNVLIEKYSKNKNLSENIKSYWQQLDQVSVDDKEYKHNVEKLKKRYAEKQLSQIKDSLLKFDPVNMDISKALKEMYNTVQSIKSLDKVKAFERKTLKDAVPLFKDDYNARLENPEFDAGIKTGYSVFDEATDGLRPGELVLIGGESGGGKSMLLMNMAVQMWLQQNSLDTPENNYGPGNSVLYFSLEMPFKPCLNRVLARLSGNPSKLIRKSKLDSAQMENLKRSLRFIKKYPYEFEIVDIPRGATIEQLESIYEDAKNHYDPKIVVIDYMGLMEYENGENMDDWLKLGKISAGIHEFARVHNTTVLSAVQLNRSKGGKDDEKIGLHRIGRSALIMTNANIAVQIETRQNEKQYPDMRYHLIKNRDGNLTMGTLLKNLSCGTLIDSKAEEDDTTFEIRDPDDISEHLERLDGI